MQEVLDVAPCEALWALQFAIVEDEADPEVVHERREAEHHCGDSDWTTKLRRMSLSVITLPVVAIALHVPLADRSAGSSGEDVPKE